MILVDTHVVLWLALDPDRISKKAADAIEETRLSGEALAISDMTLLEIAVVESKRRIRLNASLETFLTEVESRFVVLPITGRVCVSAMGLPVAYPKDPADRVIGATALVEGIALVTADAEIRKSKALQHHLVKPKPTPSNQTTASRLSSTTGTFRRASALPNSDSRFVPPTIVHADRRCSCRNQPPGRQRRLRPAMLSL